MSKRLLDSGLDECLFQSLVEHCKRSDEATSIESLAKSLKIINVQSQLEQLGDRIEASLARYENEYGAATMSSRPSELDLWRLSELVWDEWKPLGRLLTIDEEQLALVELRHLQSDGPRECAYQMLLLANERSFQLRVRSIVSVLCELQLVSCARKFLDSFALEPMRLEIQ